MAREHRYCIYLLTNKNDKVMYIGVTNNLEKRVFEHKTKMIPGFTEKYNVSKLVYFEETSDIHAAIAREKEIKKWRREKKNNLVVAVNPEWKDLSAGWFEISPFGRDDTIQNGRDDTIQNGRDDTIQNGRDDTIKNGRDDNLG